MFAVLKYGVRESGRTGIGGDPIRYDREAQSARHHSLKA